MTSTPSTRPLWPAWLAVVGWTLFIYVTIPLARGFQRWVTSWGSRDMFLWFVYASVAVGLAAGIRYFRRRQTVVTVRQWTTLVLLSLVYGWGTWWLRGIPEEALHLVQYGVLSLLIFRALLPSYRDRSVFVSSFLLGSILGTVDEVIQWAVPLRYFEFRDIGINVVAVLWMQVGLAGGLASHIWARPASPISARLAWRLAVLLVLLLWGCLANTPDVWRPFHASRPELFVFDETMTEYGYLHEGPGGGSFRSRLTLDELKAQDAARAEEVGRILRKAGQDAEYGQFLRRYLPMVDPFLHEMRVHIFRRDRHWIRATEEPDDPAPVPELLRVAIGEQRLLEAWFGRSLRASDRNWTPAQRAYAEAFAAADRPYHSPVSGTMITRYTHAQVQRFMGGLVLVTVLAGLYDGRRRRRHASTSVAEAV